MKKLVFLLALVILSSFALFFISCNNEKTTQDTHIEQSEEAKDTNDSQIVERSYILNKSTKKFS